MSFPRTLHDCTYDTDPRRNHDLAQSLQGQTAIVAGAGRGIGRTIAEMLVHAGLKSIALLALEQQEAEETAKICAEINPSLEVFVATADVTDFPAIEKLTAKVATKFGSVDILVMNAGRPPQFLVTAETDPKIWWDTLAVSLQGAYVCTRAVLPTMRAQAGGRIIYTSAAGAHMNAPIGSYTLRKLGQVRLAEIVHFEEARNWIKCFAFNPGKIKTAFFMDFEDKIKGRPARDGSYVSNTTEVKEVESPKVAYSLLANDDWDSPYMAGGFVAILASGRLDFMSGRYLDAAVDINDYIKQKDDILQQDLCRVRLNLGNGELLPRLDL